MSEVRSEDPKDVWLLVPAFLPMYPLGVMWKETYLVSTVWITIVSIVAILIGIWVWAIQLEKRPRWPLWVLAYVAAAGLAHGLFLTGLASVAGYGRVQASEPSGGGVPAEVLGLPRTSLVIPNKDGPTEIRVKFSPITTAGGIWGYSDLSIELTGDLGTRQPRIIANESREGQWWGDELMTRDETAPAEPSFVVSLQLGEADRFAQFAIHASMTVWYPELVRGTALGFREGGFVNRIETINVDQPSIVVTSEDLDAREALDIRKTSAMALAGWAALGLTLLAGTAVTNWRLLRRWERDSYGRGSNSGLFGN